MTSPSKFRQIVATKLTTDFQESAQIVEASAKDPGPNEILVKNKYVGINATDINTTNGKYNPGVPTPFVLGLEAVAEVVSVGAEVKDFQVGQIVGSIGLGTYAEYQTVSSKLAFPLPAAKPEFLALFISGMTADLSLHNLGNLKAGQTVLVTAAAGGTGQFAVQYAKNAGCQVIGTCSTPEKADFLKSIGCDRPVNYKTESLSEVLKNEFPNGINVVYECVGGELFDAALASVVPRGTIIQIGFISTYLEENETKSLSTLPRTLVSKSVTLAGFMLGFYLDQVKESLTRQFTLFQSGKVKVQLDNGASSPGGAFKGIDSVKRAVAYLYSKQSTGKIYVEL